MNSTRIAFLTLMTLFPLAGCTPSAPTPAAPIVPAATPSSQPAPAVSDAAKKEDQRFKREVEAKRRKSKSADIDKTNAYRNYVP